MENEIKGVEFEKVKCKTCSNEFERPTTSHHKQCWNCQHGMNITMRSAMNKSKNKK